jgi:hypothetical protein
MIEIKEINSTYHVGREKPGGKVYVSGPSEGHVASYSGITETLEWYQAVSEEDKALIQEYLKKNY